MKKIITILVFSFASIMFADDAVWPSWYKPPKHSTTTTVNQVSVDVPASSVKLLIKTSDNKLSEHYPNPSLLLILGMKNVGQNEIGARHVISEVMSKGVLCCKFPDKSIKRIKIPPFGLRSSSRPLSPNPIKHNNEFYYSRWPKEITKWFGTIKSDGSYVVWWEWNNKKSNTLEFTHKDSKLKFVQ